MVEVIERVAVLVVDRWSFTIPEILVSTVCTPCKHNVGWGGGGKREVESRAIDGPTRETSFPFLFWKRGLAANRTVLDKNSQGT
jgi:hypothetical protein